MKKLSIIISFILFALVANCQTDSIKVKITRVKTQEDRTHYWMKDIKTGTKYETFCQCPERRKREKGEVIKISKQDLIEH